MSIAAPPVSESPPASSPGGLSGWIAATDHKASAARMALVAFGFFLVAGAFALLMRGELAEPGLQLVSADGYNQLFTMHGSTMVFLVVTPLALAVGLYMVPLQLGAADVAAPRLTLAGQWALLAGGLIMFSGFLTAGGAAKAGWTAYYPLSGSSASQGSGTDLWLAGVLLAIAGSTIVGATILATILRLRAPGMTMLRMPVFCWAMFATCLLVVMSFPAVIAAMALLIGERLGLGVLGLPDAAIAYQNLFWFYGHPAVYVMFFPFLGIVAEVIATFSRRRFFGYRPMVFALLAFTGLSMSVWAHHKFATGQVSNQYFSLTSTLLIVPAGIEYFDLIATMIGGTIALRAPMLFALGFLAQFLIGGVTGIWVAATTLDLDAHDSYFIVAHFHYTLFAGSLFGLFAGVFYWFPKVTGALLRDGLGKLQFALLLIGSTLTFAPMFALGQAGMPRRIADYSSADGWTALNVISSVGAVVIAAGILVFLVNLWVSLRHRRPAGPDPWEAHTLEWATSSPPPRFNFRVLPPITSYAPLYDLRERDPRLGEHPVAEGDEL